jgi:hypothetical protein
MEHIYLDNSKTGQKRTSPQPGAEKEGSCPLAIRLTIARTRQVALRYYVSRFPTLNMFQAVRIPATRRTTSKWVRTKLSSNEEEAVRDLKIENKSTFMTSDVSTVVKTLETRRKFADKEMVNYDLARKVNAISNDK